MGRTGPSSLEVGISEGWRKLGGEEKIAEGEEA